VCVSAGPVPSRRTPRTESWSSVPTRYPRAQPTTANERRADILLSVRIQLQYLQAAKMGCSKCRQCSLQSAATIGRQGKRRANPRSNRAELHSGSRMRGTFFELAEMGRMRGSWLQIHLSSLPIIVHQSSLELVA
jgi:hypothetical protein